MLRRALSLGLVVALLLTVAGSASASGTGIRLEPAQGEGENPVVVADYPNPYYDPDHPICAHPAYWAYNPDANACRPFLDVTQDWLSIYEALVALKNAGGGTLELGEGTYQVNASIDILDLDMAGIGSLTIKGANTEDTVVRGVPLSEGFEPSMIEWGFELTAVLSFTRPINGKIILGDLTLEVLDEQPSRPYWNPWDEIDDTPQTGEATSLNNMFVAFSGSADLVVKDVLFRGADGDARGANVMYPFIGGLWNDHASSIAVKDSVFHRAGDSAIELWAMPEGSEASIKDTVITGAYQGVTVCVWDNQWFDVLIKDSFFSDNTYHIAGGEEFGCSGLDRVVVKDSEPDHLNTDFPGDDG